MFESFIYFINNQQLDKNNWIITLLSFELFKLTQLTIASIVVYICVSVFVQVACIFGCISCVECHFHGHNLPQLPGFLLR